MADVKDANATPATVSVSLHDIIPRPPILFIIISGFQIPDSRASFKTRDFRPSDLLHTVGVVDAAERAAFLRESARLTG